MTTGFSFLQTPPMPVSVTLITSTKEYFNIAMIHFRTMESSVLNSHMLRHCQDKFLAKI